MSETDPGLIDNDDVEEAEDLPAEMAPDGEEGTGDDVADDLVDEEDGS